MSLEQQSSLEIVPNDQAPTVAIGTVTLLANGASPTVVNSGTEQSAILDFGIPAGPTGLTGAQGNAGTNGANGADGANATNPNFTIGTVTSLSPGSTPTATITGTYPNLTLNLGLTRGDTGSGSATAWGDITGTFSAQTDLQTALGAKAPLASPTFTGTPLVPTAAAGTNTTQAASTEFVHAAVALLATLDSPTFTGSVNAPTPTAGDNDTSVATTAFVHGEIAGLLNNAALTGAPTAPTPTAGDNDTSIATTAFVHGAVAALAPVDSPVFTGDPRVPSPPSGDNDTSIASTAWVTTKLGSYAKLTGGAALTGDPTADGNLIGYRNLPTSRSPSTAITLADTDKGKKIVCGGATARAITINPNASTAIDSDAIITVVNDSSAIWTVSRGAGVSCKLMGTGADANRSIAPGGVCTLMKTATNTWYAGGPGVS